MVAAIGERQLPSLDVPGSNPIPECSDREEELSVCLNFGRF
jgi:hypothetical protein